MEVSQLISYVMFFGSILGVFGVILWLRSRTDDSIDTLAEMEVAIVLARELVVAAEQLWETGQIEKVERFDYVMSKLMMIFPNLDVETLEALLEAAVKWSKIIAPKVEAIIVDVVGED